MNGRASVRPFIHITSGRNKAEASLTSKSWEGSKQPPLQIKHNVIPGQERIGKDWVLQESRQLRALDSCPGWNRVEALAEEVTPRGGTADSGPAVQVQAARGTVAKWGEAHLRTQSSGRLSPGSRFWRLPSPAQRPGPGGN